MVFNATSNNISHDLPTLQPLITLTETCLELDHELAYSSIAEVETSPLDILSISCNKFVKSTDIKGCNVGKSCGLNLARSTMLTIGGSDALFAFLISNNNFKVLWDFSSQGVKPTKEQVNF
jgi:hypothetical protein